MPDDQVVGAAVTVTSQRDSMPSNIYFQLTEEFNATGRNVLLASGQAVVFYRLAIMSKDGDWIIRETEEACRHVLSVLAEHGARYRPGAPLAPRWLAGGWSSHLEFNDSQERRVRCDFFSRPPRIPRERIEELFARPEESPVVDVESLIRMKRTQRAKDYPVIGELARLLPAERELRFTTDPDRIIELSSKLDVDSDRPSVRATRSGKGRRDVVQALALEMDDLQEQDRERVELHSRAAEAYLRAVSRLDREDLRLPEGHERLTTLAEELLPASVPGPGDAS